MSKFSRCTCDVAQLSQTVAGFFTESMNLFLLGIIVCVSVCVGVMGSRMQSCLPQRENLKFLVACGHTATQSWRLLQGVYGEECMSHSQVQVWHRRFAEGDGHTPVTDLHRSGRPRSKRTPEAVGEVQAAVGQDKCKTCHHIAEETGLSKSTVHRIVRGDLHLKKKAPKFVPHILTDEQKRMCMKLCSQNLALLADHPDLLEFIVTGDESFVPLYDPDTKLSSMHWLTAEEPCPQKALCTRTQTSTMLITFFDSKGMLLKEFVPRGETVTGEFYVQVLTCLQDRVQRKRPDLWSTSRDGEHHNFWLHHDNASSHTCVETLAFFGTHHLLLLPHPPYSPDLAPNNFFLYPTLKRQLRGKKHRNVAEVQAAVDRALKTITPDMFKAALLELPRRWTKCLNKRGDYFEGWHVNGDDIAPELAMEIEEQTRDSDDSEFP